MFSSYIFLKTHGKCVSRTSESKTTPNNNKTSKTDPSSGDAPENALLLMLRSYTFVKTHEKFIAKKSESETTPNSNKTSKITPRSCDAPKNQLALVRSRCFLNVSPLASHESGCFLNVSPLASHESECFLNWVSLPLTNWGTAGCLVSLVGADGPHHFFQLQAARRRRPITWLTAFSSGDFGVARPDAARLRRRLEGWEPSHPNFPDENTAHHPCTAFPCAYSFRWKEAVPVQCVSTLQLFQGQSLALRMIFSQLRGS